MQPKDPSYKPKTTIIQANPNIYCDGLVVVAWVIEDGRIARAICHDPKSPVAHTTQRGAEE